MRRNTLSLIVAAVTLCSSMTLCSCGSTGGGNKNADTHIEVYAYKAGYGIEWIQNALKAFQEEKKAEGIEITYKVWGDDLSQQTSLIPAGAKGNSVDLFAVATQTGTYYAEKGSMVLKGYDCVVEPLDDVYATVMEDGKTYEEKLIQELLPNKINGHYYGVPWSYPVTGLVYNKTLFDQIGISAPATTDELLEICTEIKSYYAGYNAGQQPKDQVAPFIFTSSVGYWNYLRDVWWMQYEGTEQISNFANGIYVDEDGNASYSKEIFNQTGRLRSLETLYSLIEESTGNAHPNVNTMDFTTSQGKFLLGKGLMMPTGDWFENEMSSVKDEMKEDYEIRMMKAPVISSIVEKLEYRNGGNYMTDDMLRSIVDEVDEGKSWAQSSFNNTVTESDYNKISDARRMVNSLTNCELYIPVYASAKDLAKEFLKFIGSDKGLQIYIDSTSGNQLPFKYDLKSDTARWNTLSSFQKDAYEMRNNSINYSVYAKYKINVEPYNNGQNCTEIYFTAKNAADKKTPSMIMADEYTYWTSARWSQLLKEAGIE